MLPKPLPGTPLNFAHPLAQGLVVSLPFNDAYASTVRDYSGQGHHGAITNAAAATAWVGSVYGAALDLPGTTDYIEVPRTTRMETQAFTASVLFWWHTNVGGQYSSIFEKCRPTDTAPYTSWFIGQYGNGANIRGAVAISGTYRASGATAVSLNAWHMFTLSWQTGDSIRFYVDGHLRTLSLAYSGTLSYYDSPMRLGRHASENNPGIQGMYAGAWLYNRALSAQEVAQLAQDPFAMYRRQRVLYVPAAPAIPTVTLADGLTLADSLRLRPGLALADGIGAADALGTRPDLTRADLLNLSDAHNLRVLGVWADTLQAADAMRLAPGLGLADNVEAADALQLRPQVRQADTVQVTDQQALTVFAAWAETVTLTDSAALAPGVKLASTVTLADAVALRDAVTIRDVMTLADALSLRVGLVLADNIGAADSLSFIVDLEWRDLFDASGRVAPAFYTAGVRIGYLDASGRMRVALFRSKENRT